jgi:hypothetical protein
MRSRNMACRDDFRRSEHMLFLVVEKNVSTEGL